MKKMIKDMSNKEKMTKLWLMRRNRRTSDSGSNVVDALWKNNEKNDKDVEGEGEHIENEKLEEEEEKEEKDQRFMLNKEKMTNLRLMRRNRRTSDNGSNVVDALRKNNEKIDQDVEGLGEHVENEELEEEEKEENDQRFMLIKEKMTNLRLIHLGVMWRMHYEKIMRKLTRMSRV